VTLFEEVNGCWNCPYRREHNHMSYCDFTVEGAYLIPAADLVEKSAEEELPPPPRCPLRCVGEVVVRLICKQ
jgi:hypothetical protein